MAVRCVFWFFFFPSSYAVLWDSKTPHRTTSERVSCCLETSPPSWLPPQDGSPSLTLYLSSCLLYFALPTFKENGLPFWVPGVLRQHPEVALWNLLNIQMICWWICRGESGLPVLFFHHLRTTSQWYFFLNPYVLKVCIYFYHTQTMICFLTNFLGDHFFLHVLIFL